MTKKVFVQDFMTKDIISVGPETPVVEVVKIIFVNGFNGVPVVDAQNSLIGLITEYDFIAKGTPIYFSPLAPLIDELAAFHLDEKEIDKKIKQTVSLLARDIMNTDPLTLSPTHTLKDAADLFLKHHRINPIPVIDENHKVVGIVSRHDLMRLFADSTFWKELFLRDDRTES